MSELTHVHYREPVPLICPTSFSKGKALGTRLIYVISRLCSVCYFSRWTRGKKIAQSFLFTTKERFLSICVQKMSEGFLKVFEALVKGVFWAQDWQYLSLGDLEPNRFFQKVYLGVFLCLTVQLWSREMSRDQKLKM